MKKNKSEKTVPDDYWINFNKKAGSWRTDDTIKKSAFSLSTDEKKRIADMFHTLSGAPQEVLPSKYWIDLNEENMAQLENTGFENFKRTIALNYFTWILAGNGAPIRYLVRSMPQDKQVKYLTSHLPATTTCANIFRTVCFPKKHQYFTWTQSLAYNFFTNMLWDYTKKNDPENLLEKINEPLVGNPPRLYRGKKLISQDLAHSILEYYSATEHIHNKQDIKTIIELGAGYGRTAYVFLKALPHIKYIVVDIPPALWVAEKYLSETFPEKKVFRFRPWHSFQEIETEFKNADIVFLLSSQLELLPPKCADMFVNISSLHEMRMDQITYYFTQIERVISGYFYFKQWKTSKIPFENIIIKEEDYPMHSHWKKIYSRECAVQVRFFESLFRIK